MPIFLFIVTIYSAANYYFYSKLFSIVNPEFPIDILIGIAIVFMTLSPVLIPVYSHKGSEKAVRIFSYAGYMWLAFLVPFFPLGIIFDLYNLALQFSVPYMGNVSLHKLSADAAFWAPLFISMAVNAYGLFEANNMRIERLAVNSPKMPKSIGRVRIAQISDLHLSVTVGEKILDKVISKIEGENPDIIVSTGDLIDGIVRHVDHLSVRLRDLNARYGKFAVMGNHEFYGGLKHTVKFIEDSGFTVLRNNGVALNNIINIAGVDFTGGETIGYRHASVHKTEREILSALPTGLFTLLLKHRSDVEEDSLGLFDLQLSGHSHKGQIFPMNLATMFLFRYHTGFTKLPKGSAIYTSRGTGTAGPPVRFLSAPEITIIDIVA